MLKPKSPTPVLATKHKDKRANIPTEELRDFVADDEKAPKKILYPRDLSLDPQLVWKGKDEQDASPLEVPAVPIYIQEKIHPQVIIENLRDTAKAGEKEQPLELFGDFNGIIWHAAGIHPSQRQTKGRGRSCNTEPKSVPHGEV